MPDLLPRCAHRCCALPGVVRIELRDAGGPVWADLCPLHALDIRECLGEIADARDERRARLAGAEALRLLRGR